MEQVDGRTHVNTTGEARPQALWVFIGVSVFALAGTRLASIAVPWYVLTTTGSPTLTGLVAFAEMAPYVVVKALAGPWIDRVGPVRVSILSAAASALAVAAVPLLHGSGLLGYPALVVLVALIGIFRAPGDGAKVTLIPMVAKASGSTLERVSGAFGAVDRLAATLGAAFGGLVIAVVGGANALWLTVGTFALDALLLALVLTPMLAGTDLRAPRGDAGTSYVGELREGWQFLRGDSVLVSIVAMLAVTNMLEQAFGVALVPVWAMQTGGGPGAIGLLFATAAAFSVAGAMIAAALGERLPRRPVYVFAYLLVGVPRFAVLALGAPLPVALAVLAVTGLATGFINPIIGAVVVERIPGRLMGRVNTLAMACAWALLPFGGLVGGLLVTAVGLSTALWIVAGFYLVVTMSPTLLPAWKHIERGSVVRPDSPGSAAPMSESQTPAESESPARDDVRPGSSRVRGSRPARRARSPRP